MIIGIIGKKRTGKDTVGSIIQYLISLDNGYNKPFATFVNEDKNNDVKIVKFADNLKKIVSILIGCSKEDLENEEFKNMNLPSTWDNYTYDLETDKCSSNSITPRKMLQILGTDLIRNQLCENTWVNATMVDYTHTSKWVITDVRFPNEAFAILDKKGILIRVDRDTGILDNHESETALDDFGNCHHVNNNYSIEELIITIQSILKLENIIN